ncbi:peptidase C15, pyroglutamyl peptidase I-like protein [Atractiella rhizophila]|nr:peptidase C15, pyroglutamyl peptidase I-like protein [Atractiella rhizophila]
MGGTDVKDESRPLHCCLTGFGPFSRSQDNPSWLAARELDGRLLTPPPGSKSDKKIQVSAYEIPVVWDSVLNIVPTFHGLPPAELSKQTDETKTSLPLPVHDFDLFVHCGLGLNGTVRFETIAHRYGYGQSADWEGKYPPAEPRPDRFWKVRRKGFVGEQWDDLTDGDNTPLRTVVDVPALQDWVQKHIGVDEIVTISNDAGLYLCEFIFFASMACAVRCSRGEGVEKATGRQKPVLFIHVTDIGKPFSLEGLTRIIEAAIWGIAGEGLVKDA